MGISVASGNTSLFLNDIDDSLTEYANDFSISLPTTFGDIGNRFVSQRTGVSSPTIISLSDYNDNEYYKTSLFQGSWSGNSFNYQDNILTYDLGFNYASQNFLGDSIPAKLYVSYIPLSPLNNSTYNAKYITGLDLSYAGRYDYTPSMKVDQYYYVTGLQNALESLLFSSGCGETLGINYVQDPSIGLKATGNLVLKKVKISGLYGIGVNTFKVVSGYSGVNYGSGGYTSTPTFVLSTGGTCYSLPDYQGVELAQFKRATGYGALYAHAAGATGYPIMTGKPLGVTGIVMTNIGMGYDTVYQPRISWIRQSQDSYNANIKENQTSAVLYTKNTGLYNFGTFWQVYAGDKKSSTLLNNYNGSYSGSFDISGAGVAKVKIILSGLDNTAPISGGLTLLLSGNGKVLTGQWIVSQSRTFDLSPNAMVNPAPPSDSTVPLPDFSFSFGQDQYEEQYISDIGQNIDNIIEF